MSNEWERIYIFESQPETNGPYFTNSDGYIIEEFRSKPTIFTGINHMLCFKDRSDKIHISAKLAKTIVKLYAKWL